MTEPKLLASQNIIAFVTVVDVERARNFYRDVLGLTLLREEPPFALVFDAHGIMVRLVIARELPATHGTVLGWEVSDIEATVSELAYAGARFETFPGLAQDPKGIWTAPGGAKVAWFRDPDGNLLSLSQHPKPA